MIPRLIVFIFLVLSFSACERANSSPQVSELSPEIILAEEEASPAAESSPSEETSPVTASPAQEEACYSEMSEQGEYLTNGQIDYYKDLFASDLSIEKKLEIAQEYLRFTDNILESVLISHQNREKPEDILVTYSLLSQCQARKKEIMELSQFYFRFISQKYANDAPSTALHLTLTRFNENLAELQKSSHEVFNSKLLELSNAVPCFASACLNTKAPLPQ